jgi:hypothetical protein
VDKLTTGLVIADPYISQILRGDKTWEMRSQRTSKRETIGLIKKGSGQVFGKGKVVDCIGPLSFSELLSASDKHGISKEQVEAGLLDKWNFAWVLEDIEVFEQPIDYSHPSGAVIWVDLIKALSLKIPRTPSDINVKQVKANLSKAINTSNIISTIDHDSDNRDKLPVARDGTSFGKHLAKKGQYTVGEKGDEQKFASYEQALQYLKSMNTAKWRRPNPNGNWGIVSAIEWK